MKNLLLSFVALGFALSSQAQSITLEPFASGLSSPVDIQNAGDDRLFVVEKSGSIIILDADGNETGTFLNISSQVSTNGERGLLGLAFHPDYANNGYFFVNYTNTAGDTQISRFTVTNNPNVADPGTELEIIDYDQPYSNHNGGYLDFGADGLLYIASGDGGSGGDPENRAQNKLSPLGKVLRIDVDNPSGDNNYGIPADNPYLGNPDGLDEIWAIGLRNPFKYDFDPESNDLWIADVGQGNLEEINRVDYTVADLNYGWKCYEGTAPFNTTGCPPMNTLTFPVFEYSQNTGGCSITGGKVYRGTTYPNAQGFFFYGDYCDGRIAAVSPDNENQAFGNFPGNWSTFGRDASGEIYVGNLNGSISKITNIDVLLSTDTFDLNGFRIFPNPATNQVTFTSESQLLNSIAIYDIKGSLVSESKNLNALRQSVDTSSLSPGLYITEVTSVNGDTFSKKLIIK